MADINLLQNQLKDTTFVATKRTKLVLVLVFILLVLMVLGGGGLYFMTDKIKTQTIGVVGENTAIQTQIDNNKADLDEAKTYQIKLINLESLLQKHILLTPLLDELGKFTYLKAQYLMLDAEKETGKIHMEGQVDSYQGLGKLLLGLSTSTHFSDVKLLSVLPTGATSYSFSIQMLANPDIFVNLQP